MNSNSFFSPIEERKGKSRSSSKEIESLVPAEAIEKKEEEHGNQPVDERGEDEVHVKPRFGLCEKDAARNHD